MYLKKHSVYIYIWFSTTISGFRHTLGVLEYNPVNKAETTVYSSPSPNSEPLASQLLLILQFSAHILLLLEDIPRHFTLPTKRIK